MRKINLIILAVVIVSFGCERPSMHNYEINTECQLNMKILWKFLVNEIEINSKCKTMDCYITEISKQHPELLYCPIHGKQYLISNDVKKWKEYITGPKFTNEIAMLCPDIHYNNGTLYVSMTFSGGTPMLRKQ